MTNHNNLFYRGAAISLVALTVGQMPMATHGATVSRIDVAGNSRMDAESIRILSDVKIG